jgi:hypothetical protein
MSAPPGAGVLSRVRRQGLIPKNRQVEVVLGWSWRRTPTFGVVRVTVPDDDLPASFDWHFVRGLDVVVLVRQEPVERVEEVLNAIRPHQPRRLLAVHFNGGRLVNALPKREAAHAQLCRRTGRLPSRR